MIPRLVHLSQNCFAYLGSFMFPYKFLKYLFIIYFWLCWVLVAACRIFHCNAQALCCRTWSLQLWHVGFRTYGPCSCGMQALQQQSAPQHLASYFPHRNQTHAPCVGRQILNHQTYRDFLSYTFQNDFFQFCEDYCWYFDRFCTEFVDCLGQYGYFNNISASSPCIWFLFLSVCVLFSFLSSESYSSLNIGLCPRLLYSLLGIFFM